jgi:hypothetical protein
MDGIASAPVMLPLVAAIDLCPLQTLAAPAARGKGGSKEDVSSGGKSPAMTAEQCP